MDVRHDPTEDFCSAMMGWNMDLPLGLPAKETHYEGEDALASLGSGDAPQARQCGPLSV